MKSPLEIVKKQRERNHGKYKLFCDFLRFSGNADQELVKRELEHLAMTCPNKTLVDVARTKVMERFNIAVHPPIKWEKRV